ncbi:hypothetical protein BLA29_010172 [Euroglyphus maynei]|uniref:Succinate dehydrogenase assembly factor 4, mitochondrial n=1 Tax=Euroglyphus maynei TaxID=6958 RepID=A0A1Y3B1Q8_EURMA|nr:hypothetical protein BLA29_010172 [Euroglyphus maynei]
MLLIRANHWFQITIIRNFKIAGINQLWSADRHEQSKKDVRAKVQRKIAEIDTEQLKSPNSPLGLMYRSPHVDPNSSSDILARSPNPAFDPFPNERNPETGEINGPTGPEPTRYGDWERKGRCSDF